MPGEVDTSLGVWSFLTVFGADLHGCGGQIHASLGRVSHRNHTNHFLGFSQICLCPPRGQWQYGLSILKNSDRDWPTPFAISLDLAGCFASFYIYNYLDHTSNVTSCLHFCKCPKLC